MEKVNTNLVSKIKRYLKRRQRPLIIVISGVNGSGKTTLAFHLSNILEIKQRVSLGSVVKTLISVDPKNKAFVKMDNHFSLLSKTEIQEQALIISRPVNLIIRKYDVGGVSCIIEGVQLLSRYLDDRVVHFHISVTDHRKYKKQLNSSDTRNSRNVSEKQFVNLLKINEILKGEMSYPKIHLLDNSKSLTSIINEVLKNIVTDLNLK
jgi:2-phosphoglycerate kinase